MRYRNFSTAIKQVYTSNHIVDIYYIIRNLGYSLSIVRNKKTFNEPIQL